MIRIFLSLSFTILSLIGYSQLLTEAEFFIDNDPGVGNAIPVAIAPGDSADFTITYNTDTLEAGMHFVQVRVKDTSGTWSLYARKMFVVSKKRDSQLMKAEYFINSDPGEGKATPLTFSPADSIDLNINIDTDTLEPGIHFVHVRVKDSSGKWSINSRKMFVVSPKRDAQLKTAEYFINSDPGAGQGIPITFSPADTIDLNAKIDTDTLSIGQHILHIRVLDKDNSWSLYSRDTFEVIQCQISPGDADFTETGDFCEGGNITFTRINSSVPDSLLQYDWDINADDTIDIADKVSVNFSFPASGQYAVRLYAREKGESLCYDTITKNITVHSSSYDSTSNIICPGDSVFFAGIYISAAGSYSDSLITVDGCDSISKLNLALHPAPSTPVISKIGNSLTTTSASSYQWYFNGNAIPGATAQTHTPTENGDYTVNTTNANGCSAVSDEFVVNFVGLPRIHRYEITFHPNPSLGIITVESEMDGVEMIILNVSGKELSRHKLEQSKESINLNLQKGVYILKFRKQGIAFKSKKLIIL